MGVKIKDLVSIIEELIPPKLAETWDNQGFLIGDLEAKASGILIALDFRKETLQEAIKKEANFLLVHHPPIFKPLKRLVKSKDEGGLLLKAIKEGMNIYAAHTSLDKIQGGVSDLLGEALGLLNLKPLVSAEGEKNYKLVVFVPKSHEEKVRKALGDAGAGFIGKYSHCTFRTEGTGTFLPQVGANPYSGQIGQMKQAEEYRLETIVPKNILKDVLKAMYASHPYEEVAYDLYLLANQERATAGLGRIGELPKSMDWRELAQLVKETLSIPQLKVVKGADSISKVAVLGGSGGSAIGEAFKAGAQALVTGDVDFHQGQYAQSLGLTVIDGGHYWTERIIIPPLVKKLREKLNERNISLSVYNSEVNTDPWFYC